MSLLLCVIHISVIHITFHSQIDLQLKRLLGDCKSPHFTGNLWRCLSFVKCSLNQTKCQSTLYHTGEANMRWCLCQDIIRSTPREVQPSCVTPYLALRHGACVLQTLERISHGRGVSMLNFHFLNKLPDGFLWLILTLSHTFHSGDLFPECFHCRSA